MLFNVPQYIDVEDKIAGPLTAKQLLWMIGMGATLMVLWNMFDSAAFFALAIPVVCIFVAFAFYRPYNQPLVLFIGNAILFLIRPKVYVWNRTVKPTSTKEETKEKEEVVKVTKKVTAVEVSRLARIVDNQNK